MTEQQPRFDLMLQGGHVIDPADNIDGRTDVAIKDGKIATVSPDIGPSRAAMTVNVDGLYVTPGLIDIHVHAFAGDETHLLAALAVD
jgi:dihydroorotase